LIANQPEVLDSHTHLVIDEVHKRSVDADLLCYLVRNALGRNPQLKVVLMSATLHTDLYTTYFAKFVTSAPLFVGVRTFPVEMHFADDLHTLNLPKRFDKDVNFLQSLTEVGRRVDPKLAETQYPIVQWIVRTIGKVGSAVLVFVSGMSDIVALSDMFTGYEVYDVFFVHSSIPYEDQLGILEPSAPDKIKIILATNAAESSLTLPDVDLVICLGACKNIKVDPKTGQPRLAGDYISRAAATQRSGRTGRVRPGVCWRLYSEELFGTFAEHDPSEVQSTPLDKVVLDFKHILKQPVVKTLCSLIEPPEMSRLDLAFVGLAAMGMIVSADDGADLTGFGMLATSMPCDLHLSYMLALSVRLGCAAEAVVIAAALSAPQSPFREVYPFHFEDKSEYGTVRVFRQNFTLEDAISSHACSLQASWIVINAISLGCPLFVPVHTVNCVQTLKASCC
jgi:HrpA-like RNA helicase